MKCLEVSGAVVRRQRVNVKAGGTQSNHWASNVQVIV